MSELLDKMKNYGADVDGAMNRFLSDEELYETCMQIFIDDPVFFDLGKAIDQQNYLLAFDYAHNLKGVSGNLALTPLYVAVTTLVEALRGSDYCNVSEQYTSIINEYNKIKILV